MTSLQHFLSELKRRRVYRVAIVYAAVAFVVWQVADIALPSLGLPETAVTLVLVLTLLGFPVALVLAWAYELRPEEPAPATATEPAAAADPVATDPASRKTPTPTDRSIAILPFENMSTEEESEYFADGISEELTHALGRTAHLRVAARTSAFAFKGQRIDVREIGTRLNVAHVVEGSVRRAGNRLRVTAQLIDTRDGYHVWSDRFERTLDDVFAIQDDIVEAVVGSLMTKLGGVAPSIAEGSALPRTEDLDAYDLFLRARHHLRGFDGAAITEAVRLCEQSLELDPSFAPSHATLAEALTTQALGFFQGDAEAILPRARRAAEEAIALDPELPAAHLARGLTLLYHDWAFREARAALERALSLNPSFVDAHRWLEFYWTYVENDYVEAIAAIARARELDPIDARLPLREATVEYIFGHFNRAEAIIAPMLAAEPDSMIAKITIMDTYLRAGRIEEAAALAETVPIVDEVPDVALGVTGVVLASAGETERARTILATLEERSRTGYSLPFWRAILHSALGELDRAYELLDLAVEDRDGGLLYLSVVPDSTGVRNDPRYGLLLRRMGLGHLAPPT